MTDTMQDYFRRILGTHKYLGTHDQKKVAKSAKNDPEQYLSLLSANKGYKGSQGAILKIMGPAIFKYKMHFLKKLLIITLDEVEVQI